MSPPLATSLCVLRGGPHQAHGRLGNIPFERNHGRLHSVEALARARARPRNSTTELTVGRAKTRTSGINRGYHQSSHTHTLRAFPRGTSPSSQSIGQHPFRAESMVGSARSKHRPAPRARPRDSSTELTVGQVITCTSGINCGLPPLSLPSVVWVSPPGRNY